MSDALLWTVFSLSVLIALGRFLDFLLGDRGRRQVKDRLVAWYIHTHDASWAALPIWLAARISSFFDQVFGPHLFGRRAIILAILISLSLNTAYALVLNSFSMELASRGRAPLGLPARVQEALFDQPVVFAILFVGAFDAVAVALDLISLVLSRAIFRRMVERAKAWRLLLFDTVAAGFLWLAALSAGYFAFQEGFERAVFSSMTVHSYVDAPWLSQDLQGVYVQPFDREAARRVFSDGGVRRFTEDAPPFLGWADIVFPPEVREPPAHPSEGDVESNAAGWRGIRFTILLSASTILIPTSLALLTVLTAKLVSFARPFAEPVVLVLLQRLEEAPRGVFTTLGVFISALVGLVTAAVQLL